MKFTAKLTHHRIGLSEGTGYIKYALYDVRYKDTNEEFRTDKHCHVAENEVALALPPKENSYLKYTNIIEFDAEIVEYTKQLTKEVKQTLTNISNVRVVKTEKLTKSTAKVVNKKSKKKSGKVLKY